MTPLRQLLKTNWALFLLFFLVVVLFYGRTIGAGFSADFICLAQLFDEKGWPGITSQFPSTGVLPVYYGLFFAFYKTFGLHGLPWLLIQMLLHTLVGWLLFILIRWLLKAYDNPQAFGISLMSAILFLLSPYAAEVVIWGPAIHYLLMGIIIMGCMLMLLQYAKTENNIFLLLIPIVFFIALFTIEFALMIPLLLLALIWISPDKLIANNSKKKLSLTIVLPQLFIITAYFAICKIATGHLFTHYEGQPVTKINIAFITAVYVKHFLKFTFFFTYFPYDWRAPIYDFIEQPIFSYIAFAILLTATVIISLRIKYLSSNTKALLLLFIFYSLLMLPIVNLYHHPFFPYENERHTYLASMFFFPFMALLTSCVFRKYQFIPVGVYLFISVGIVCWETSNWCKAAQVRDSLINDFRWYDNDRIYVLSMPNYFKGPRIFESNGTMLGRFLLVNTHKDIRSKIREVTQFNMVDVHDSVSVQVKSDSVFTIETVAPTARLWFYGLGAVSNETDEYRTIVNGSHFDFIAKIKPPNSVYIYSAGGKWKEAKFNVLMH